MAERIASLIPDAVLVRLPTAGHSVLDTRERAALAVIEAVRNDDIGRLPALAPELDALPGRPGDPPAGVGDFGGRRRRISAARRRAAGGAAGHGFMKPILV